MDISQWYLMGLKNDRAIPAKIICSPFWNLSRIFPHITGGSCKTTSTLKMDCACSVQSVNVYDHQLQVKLLHLKVSPESAEKWRPPTGSSGMLLAHTFLAKQHWWWRNAAFELECVRLREWTDSRHMKQRQTESPQSGRSTWEQRIHSSKRIPQSSPFHDIQTKREKTLQHLTPQFRQWSRLQICYLS